MRYERDDGVPFDMSSKNATRPVLRVICITVTIERIT